MTTIEMRIRGTYDSLSNAERKVADYFLANLDCIFNQPIAQLAKNAGVSQVAWVRLAKSIGFDGLKSMKKSLFNELNTVTTRPADNQHTVFTDIKDFSSIEELISAVGRNSIQSVESTLSLLTPEIVEQIVQRMIDAPCIRLFGVGASALVAEDLFNKLLRINQNVCFSHDHHIQLTYAANTCDEDVCFFISNSGRTKEVIEAFESCRTTKATLITLTSLSKAQLCINADFSLYTSSQEHDHRSGAMSSRIAQLVVIDVLFTALANRNYDHVIEGLIRSSNSCKSHRLA